MNAIDLAHEVIEEVYGSIFIPSIHDSRFLTLIHGTKRLIELTLIGERSRHEVRSLTVSFIPDSMASTDERSVISIPAWYCVKESLEKFLNMPLDGRDAAAVALTLVNGSSIHEALHVAYSQELFKRRKAGHFKKPNQTLFDYLLNVCEDLKNETIIKSRPSLFRFVNTKNEIFFDEKRMRDARVGAEKRYYGEKKSIALELLVFYKCIARRDEINALLEEFKLDNVEDLLTDCLDPNAEVAKIAEKLYEIFDTSKAATSEHMIDQMMMALSALASKEMDKAKPTPDGTPTALMTIEMESDTAGIPPVEVVDVMSKRFKDLSGWDYIHLTDIKTNFSFVKRLKLVREVVPSMSEPKRSGSKLINTRLARIVTDSKMFSTRGESVASIIKKQPEFVIVVDASGSMIGGVDEVLSFVKKLSYAMVEDGVPHTVVAHTSTGGNNAPIVYHIFSHKMNGRTDADLEGRFDKICGIQLKENLDGIALEEASKFFTNGKRRIMLVLSDGTPCSPNYFDGKEHTKSTVRKLRSSGITVISLSLTRDVIDDNNEIYGRENNIDASSQSKLENGMMRLILS